MEGKNLDKWSVLIAAVAVALVVAVMSLSRTGKHVSGVEPLPEGRFTAAEDSIIAGSDSVMRVLSVYDAADSLVLRAKSGELSVETLQSDAFKSLAEKMLQTVQAPQYNGVGLAAPQVGILKRLIVVCRVDKEGEPFEVYPNARLDSLYGPITHGPEGCLSIPGLRGNVDRYSSVIVSYNDPVTTLPRRDTVNGYAAIIFQHECDHLEGVLYTDKADSLMAVCTD